MFRQWLTEDITVHVTSCGSLQEEYDKLATDYDMKGFAATFILDSTSSATLDAKRPLVGGSKITVDGGGAAIAAGGKPAMANNIAGLTMNLKNMKLAAWSGGHCVWAMFGGMINLREGMEFCAGDGDHILASYGGQVLIKNSYLVSGGGLNHWHSYSGGYITATDLTVTVIGTPWFTRWAGVADAGIVARNIAYNGTIHGAKYLVHKNGFMEIGTNDLPGDVAGCVATGGVIA